MKELNYRISEEMGIQNFSKFIKRYAPNSCLELPLEVFKGRRIAVDMNGLIYKMMCGAANELVEVTDLAQSPFDYSKAEKKTLDLLLHRLEIFTALGIIPVCVFDGKPHPLKQNLKRQTEKLTRKKKLAEAEEELYSTEPLLRTEEMINKYKNCIRFAISPHLEFIEKIKNLLGSIGYPVISAEDFTILTKDAEGLCASLCLPGNDYCYAAFTEDSDFHVYGGNIQIIEIFSKRIREDPDSTKIIYQARIRVLERILNETGLTFPQFRDFCIMMGTDYNTNIPKIGLVRGLKYIRTYGSVENLRLVLNTDVLNYAEVIKIYNSPIAKINLDPKFLEFNKERFQTEARNLLKLYDLEFHYLKISEALNPRLSSEHIPGVPSGNII